MARAAQLSLTNRQRSLLEKWAKNKAETPHRLVERCEMILGCADGASNAEMARRLGGDSDRVGRWRARWIAASGKLREAEAAGAKDKDFAKLVGDILEDSERSGAPSTFSAEQLALIIAVGCERPCDSGLPVDRWTPAELTREVVRRGIVERISPRHVDRILKGGISVRTRAATG